MYRYIDGDGNDIKSGDRVRLFGTDGSIEAELGVIESISDPDGDVDEGRIVGIPPSVTVHFDDGVEDSFIASWTATGPWDEEAPYRCDDIELMKEEA